MKLHGFAISNYYNIAKIGLLEKGISFEEVVNPPSSDEAFLAMSPMGKIPVLETADGFLSESQAILQYLEVFQAEPRLYPVQPFAAGKAQQIHQFFDLYIDSPARKLLGAAFFGKETNAEEIETANASLAKAVTALGRIVAFEPFIAGNHFTHADIAAYMNSHLASAIMSAIGAPDPFAGLPGFANYLEMIGKRPSFEKTMADREIAMAQYFAAKKG